MIRNFRLFLNMSIAVVVVSSCSPYRQVLKKSGASLLADSSLMHAHTGVAIYDAEKQQYLYRHNSNKYFVPASNTKIPTLYAGMKLLGDSLPGIRYAQRNDTVFVQPTGDPTLVHPDFVKQPVADFLERQKLPVVLITRHWRSKPLGYGWAWDDYQSSYMAERSVMPVYGNVIKWIQEHSVSATDRGPDTSTMIISDPPVNWEVNFSTEKSNVFRVERERGDNVYTIRAGREMKREIEMPFVTNGAEAAVSILNEVLATSLTTSGGDMPAGAKTIYSQPADSMYRPLMYRSDNFFAEQTLLMASMQLLGYMDEQRLIDTLLKTHLKDFPQKPRWVDGSGLSRYNLFTPEDFVWLLQKMKDEFGMETLKAIFPTGNTGTLRNFYKDEEGFIFAKTGTLSGHVALSGFLFTAKNKLLLFSVLVNNHNTSAVAVRRAVEKYLQRLRKEL